jgi:hypothetical protein
MDYDSLWSAYGRDAADARRATNQRLKPTSHGGGGEDDGDDDDDGNGDDDEGNAMPRTRNEVYRRHVTRA